MLFIPFYRTEPTSRNTLVLKAFDLAQGAASHMSSIGSRDSWKHRLATLTLILDSDDVS